MVKSANASPLPFIDGDQAMSQTESSSESRTPPPQRPAPRAVRYIAALVAAALVADSMSALVAAATEADVRTDRLELCRSAASPARDPTVASPCDRLIASIVSTPPRRVPPSDLRQDGASASAT